MAKILWTQRQDMGPSARVSHGMAYDAARQRVVLFGGVVQVGSDKFQPVADTWQWNGEFWTQVEDIGPSARGSHAMAYDASREQVILFGGNTSPNPIGEIASGDTWAWDGEGWTQVADTGPSKRMVTMMAYDEVRERVVLFGGDGLKDTWEWDGSEWTQTADDGPPGRSDGAMTYDRVRERIVLFGGGGGNDPTGRLNDTWEFDGRSWTRRSDTGPRRRTQSSMVFSGTRSILFGGEFVANEGGQLGSLRDTWEWSGTFWTERQDMGPVERAQHRMVYDSVRDRVVLFGGITIVPGVTSSDLLSDTWELPGSLITITELTFPRPLGSATLATVSLSAPAPIGGITVSLVSSNPELLEVPESVRIGDGKASEQFTVKPGQFDPTTPHFLTVTARLGTSVVSIGVHPGQVL